MLFTSFHGLYIIFQPPLSKSILWEVNTSFTASSCSYFLCTISRASVNASNAFSWSVFFPVTSIQIYIVRGKHFLHLFLLFLFFVYHFKRSVNASDAFSQSVFFPATSIQIYIARGTHFLHLLWSLFLFFAVSRGLPVLLMAFHGCIIFQSTLSIFLVARIVKLPFVLSFPSSVRRSQVLCQSP